FCGARAVAPQVVELAELALLVGTVAAQEPQVAGCIHPGGRRRPGPGLVGARRGPPGSIAARGIRRARPGNPGPQIRRWIEAPQVVENLRDAGGVVLRAAKEPENPGAVDPGQAIGTCRRNIAGRGNALHAIAAGAIGHAGAGDPGPLARDRLVLPQIIELDRVLAGIRAQAAEQPQLPAVVGPDGGCLARSGHVARGGLPLRAVAAGRAGRSGAAHPDPLAHCRFELPQIVEQAALAIGVVAIPAEEPEMPIRIRPGARRLARARQVGARGRALRAVLPGLIDRADTVNPAPAST